MRTADWGFTWEHAAVNGRPGSPMSHKFATGLRTPLCLPPIAGELTFVEGDELRAVGTTLCSACLDIHLKLVGYSTHAFRGKWLWATSLDRTYGTADTEADAVALAKAHIANSDPTNAAVSLYESDVAQRRAREIRADERAQKPPARTRESATSGEVFRWVVHFDERGFGVKLETARILKTTAKCVFVLLDATPTGGGGIITRTTVLDRKKLERDGSHRGWSKVAPPQPTVGELEFGLAPGGIFHGSASWVEILGVELPCTAEDAKRAFRRAAKKAHPDRGGTSDQFRKVTEAWAHACRDLGISA